MNIKSSIRRNTTSGAYTYGAVESYTLGLATVRLAKGGARLTSLPVACNVSIGDTIIVDYSSDVPFVRRNTTLARGTRVRPLRGGHSLSQSFNTASVEIPEP